MIRGVRKSEDTFTLYLMDEAKKWHFLDKRNLVIARNEQVHNALDPDSQASISAFLLKAPLVYEPPEEWKPAADLNVTFSRLREAAAEPGLVEFQTDRADNVRAHREVHERVRKRLSA